MISMYNSTVKYASIQKVVFTDDRESVKLLVAEYDFYFFAKLPLYALFQISTTVDTATFKCSNYYIYIYMT